MCIVERTICHNVFGYGKSRACPAFFIFVATKNRSPYLSRSRLLSFSVLLLPSLVACKMINPRGRDKQRSI